MRVTLNDIDKIPLGLLEISGRQTVLGQNQFCSQRFFCPKERQASLWKIEFRKSFWETPKTRIFGNFLDLQEEMPNLLCHPNSFLFKFSANFTPEFKNIRESHHSSEHDNNDANNRKYDKKLGNKGKHYNKSLNLSYPPKTYRVNRRTLIFSPMVAIFWLTSS